MNVGGFAPECCLNRFLNPSYRRPWTLFYFTFDNIFCLDSLLFVLLHVVSMWTRRENIQFSLPVCTNTNIALVSNEKTRNLLQKISKCDKEIQLIRIRCRHMRLQLRFFLSPAILPTSVVAPTWNRRQLKRNHTLCSLKRSDLTPRYWKIANWKPKVSRHTSAARKKWLCWLKLHKKFHEKVFGSIRWSSENRKKLEDFFLYFWIPTSFFFVLLRS